MNAVLAQYEERKGAKLDITRSTREELEANIKANPGDILSIFRLAFDLGGAQLEGLANEGVARVEPEARYRCHCMKYAKLRCKVNRERSGRCHLYHQ